MYKSTIDSGEGKVQEGDDKPCLIVPRDVAE